MGAARSCGRATRRAECRIARSQQRPRRSTIGRGAASVDRGRRDWVAPQRDARRRHHSKAGLRAVSPSLAVLLITALVQAAIFVATSSVALLADLIHNFGDALTAVPLGATFLLRSFRAEKRAGYGVSPQSAAAILGIAGSLLFVGVAGTIAVHAAR